jgi:branched-chain amino acid transport system substrate-binding protein
MRFRRSLIATAAGAAIVAGVIAEAIPAGAQTRHVKATAASSALGKPDPAKGKPVLFGAINIETQASANFPEVREAANAAINYVNTYRDGLNGHPIKVKWCITDGTPAVSSNCAKQLIADHPVAILGAADISGAAPLSIYQKAGLAVIGGTNFTPPESTAKNSLIFTDVASFSNIQNALWAAHLAGGKGKKVAVLAEGDTQGEFQANSSWVPAVESVGDQVKVFPMPPSASDLSADIEAAISWGANSIGLESPGQCVALLTGLKTDGWTGPVTSIDPCSAPPTIAASNGAANGMYFMGSLQLLSSGTPDAKLAGAILKKYAPPNFPADSPATEELSTVMNIWTAFHKTPAKKLTSAYMLKTLKSGSKHPNFLSVPYTCNGKAIPAYPDVCDSNYYLYQIKNGAAVRVGTKVYDQGTSLIKGS